MIQFIFENVSSNRIKDKLKLKSWLKKVAQSKSCLIGDLAYVFCDEDKMLEINEKYLEHSDHTDIITFNYSQELNGKKLLSGDIFISIPRVTENALLYNTTFENELLRVMAHGLLHLIGFTDETNEEKEIMIKEEDKAIFLWSL
jgi:rRNA maturation RNase YbeY